MPKSAILPASQVLERHTQQWIDRHLLIAGDIQDNYVTQIDAQSIKVHCSDFHRYQQLVGQFGHFVHFATVLDPAFCQSVDAGIYYWPKNKLEAQFQLTNILSLLPTGTPLFIVGENRSGVRAVEKWLPDKGRLTKVDTARRCSLYYFQAAAPFDFVLADWWQSYPLTVRDETLLIKALPGVFSQQHLDEGSRLLIDALGDNPHWVQGKTLDIGTGAGVLSIVLAKLNPAAMLTLTDVSAAALASSQASLAVNQLQGQIMASDVFSEINDRYDLIVSNPPFHEGKTISYSAAQKLVTEAKNHLKAQGKLVIVANSFLPYGEILKQVYPNYQIIRQTTKFKVYLAG